MNSSVGQHNKNDRGSDGRRLKTRWDDRGTQARPPAFYDQGGFPPPQGKHTRFGDNERDNGREEALATGSKRERSRERNGHENSRSHRDRDLEEQDGRRHRGSPEPRRDSAEPSKRPKREHAPPLFARCDPENAEGSVIRDIPAIPGDFAVRPASFDSVGEFFDELDGLSSPPVDQSSRRSRTPTALEVASSQFDANAAEAKPERRTSGLFDLGRTLLKNFGVSKPESENTSVPESSRVQDALETAAQAQSELQFVAERLRKAEDECRAWQEHAQIWEASEQRARDEIRRLTGECSKQSEYIDRANAQIHSLMEKHQGVVKNYEARVNALVLERGNYSSQLKQQLRAPPDARPPKPEPKADDLSLDPFNNKLDQVSEATVKSGVESLNDSLDNFTMALLDEAESLANQNSHSGFPSAIQEHEKTTKLLIALAEHSHVEEKRGFLLEANLHHGLVVELDRLFFSGEVVSRTLDSQRIFAVTLRELTKREPWTVVQRWRALTAATAGTYILHKSTKGWKNSITHYSESTVALLAWAYRQPLQTFEPLIPKIRSRLETLYDEANQLSVVARRDVLSVRMAVVVAPIGPKGVDDYLPYNTDSVTSVWPDMKVVEGDEVIALYKFGLKKSNEKGQMARLIKPEVVTTALLREMAKV